MHHSIIRYVVFIIILLMQISCIDKDVYEGDKEYDNDNNQGHVGEYISYLYPYQNEVQNVVAEITLVLENSLGTELINAEIPHLKYNKSWLFMLTQDDCNPVAYSTTWAAINGKPLSNIYFYNARQLAAGDLPPDVKTLKRNSSTITMGSTDGAGNEVRFAFTTTLYPESPDMDIVREVSEGNSGDLGRFGNYNKLTWENLAEMMSYGTSIAFHDVETGSTNSDSLMKHFDIVQKITMEKLSGRGLKVLAEPSGNYHYLLAAMKYDPMRIMTAQNTKGGGPVVELHYPYKIESDLEKAILQRTFFSNTFEITARIENELKNVKKEEREAIHVGIHSTDFTFAQYLLWLNNTYGKDGDDTVWFPSLEEYYEYNYYRVNSTINQEMSGNALKLLITLPSEQYFYYPSVTVNLSGITYDQIRQVLSNDAVTGLTYAPYDGGVMLNIDCRRFLFEHAAHFVNKYLNAPTESKRNDAIYFVEKLKESPQKEELRKKIPEY